MQDRQKPTGAIQFRLPEPNRGELGFSPVYLGLFIRGKVNQKEPVIGEPRHNDRHVPPRVALTTSYLDLLSLLSDLETSGAIKLTAGK